MNQPDIITQLRNEPQYDDHEPQHDYIFVKPMREEMLSKGGLHMPNIPDPTGNKRSSGPCLVVAVGPGPWTDRVGSGGKARLLQLAANAGVTPEVATALNQYIPEESASFLRRPMCCKPGDIVVYQGGQFLVNVNGEQLSAIQDYQVVDCRRRKG